MEHSPRAHSPHLTSRSFLPSRNLDYPGRQLRLRYSGLNILTAPATRIAPSLGFGPPENECFAQLSNAESTAITKSNRACTHKLRAAPSSLILPEAHQSPTQKTSLSRRPKPAPILPGGNVLHPIKNDTAYPQSSTVVSPRPWSIPLDQQATQQSCLANQATGHPVVDNISQPFDLNVVRYIEFLERDLEALKATIESDGLAARRKERDFELRRLDAENIRLRQDVKEMEMRYTEKLEEVESRQEALADVNDRISALEAEFRQKNAALRELERANAAMKILVKRDERLRNTLADLEVENQSLTQALLGSHDAPPALPSPSRPRGERPKLALALGSNRMSFNGARNLPRHYVAPDSVPQTPASARFCQSIVTSPETSRPISIADSEARNVTKRRLTRTFPGSKSLQPLLLPTAGGETMPASILSRPVSHRNSHDSQLPDTTNVSPPRRHSTMNAQNQALLALEGTRSYSISDNRVQEDLSVKVSSLEPAIWKALLGPMLKALETAMGRVSLLFGRQWLHIPSAQRLWINLRYIVCKCVP